MERILIIEDELDVQKVLAREFGAAGYIVESTSNGKAGIESFRSIPPSAVVLDLCLPEMPGKDVCREIRKESRSVPIVILSAMADVADKVLLLELGADDYVTKPFSPREMRARVEVAIGRRSRMEATEATRFGDISVDFTKMELTRSGQEVMLTPQEFKLLKFFARNELRVISREEILNQVWGYENYPSTRTVDNHVLRLRQKLEQDPAEPVHLLTVHGVGYKFVT